MKVSTVLLRAQGLMLAVLGVVGVSLLLGLNHVRQDVRAVEHLREQDR